MVFARLRLVISSTIVFSACGVASESPTTVVFQPPSQTPSQPPSKPETSFALFASRFDGARQFNLVLRLPDGRDTVLFSDTLPFGHPAPSPDAARAAFVRDDRGFSLWGDLYVTDNGARTRRVVSPSGATCVDPDWAPDGSTIAFAYTVENTPYRIARIAPDGQGLLVLTAVDMIRRSPQWSPDGRRIAFHANHLASNDHNIHVMNADGSNEVALTTTSRRASGALRKNRFPAWSPDGSQLAYLRDALQADTSELVVIDADGRNARTVATVPWEAGEPGTGTPPSWSPDGTSLYVEGLGRLWSVPVSADQGLSSLTLVGYGNPRWLRRR